METEIYPMAPQDRFAFACGERRACFNACCGDLHQALTPYDVLRLRGRLGLGMAEFLSLYGQRHTGPTTGMPVVTLRPLPGPERRCPFVTEAGCRVYPDRPSSCRVYPLARLLRRDHASGECREEFYLLREPHCKGFDGSAGQSVTDYVACQELAPYNRINDRMVELIGLRQRRQVAATPCALPDEAIYVALYDLERLRTGILGGRMPDGTPPGPEMLRAAGQGDEVLLTAATAWLIARLSAVTDTSSSKSG